MIQKIMLTTIRSTYMYMYIYSFSTNTGNSCNLYTAVRGKDGAHKGSTRRDRLGVTSRKTITSQPSDSLLDYRVCGECLLHVCTHDVHMRRRFNVSLPSPSAVDRQPSYLQSSCLIALIFPRAILERICARTLSGRRFLLSPPGNVGVPRALRGLAWVGRVGAVASAVPAAAPAAAAASPLLELTLVASGSATILMTAAVALNVRGLTANALLRVLGQAAVGALLPLLLLLLLTGLHLCCATWGSHPPAVLLLWGSLGSAMNAMLWESGSVKCNCLSSRSCVPRRAMFFRVCEYVCIHGALLVAV